ncbi:dTMP kinase [Cellulomonas sp. P22]|uniref:dTMP kinase n=1 Tax=Cellulomonas sp. P22 TaxID=3373189 RepID=UPI0037A08547
MSTDTPRGLLVAVCGIDGSGTSTQVDRLAEHLGTSTATHVAHVPTDLYRGDDLVRAVLEPDQRSEENIRELALFAAFDLARHARTVLRPRLAAGETVVADGYVYGSYAYFRSRGITDVEWLMHLNRYAPVPDVTICLDVPPETAASRVVHRDGSLRQHRDVDLDRMITSRRLYLDQPWGRRTSFHVVDGARPVDDVARDVTSLVESAAQELTERLEAEARAARAADAVIEPTDGPPRTPEHGTSVLA